MITHAAIMVRKCERRTSFMCTRFLDPALISSFCFRVWRIEAYYHSSFLEKTVKIETESL